MSVGVIRGVKIRKHFDYLTPLTEATNPDELAEITSLKYPKACSLVKTDAGFLYRCLQEIKERKGWEALGFPSFEDFYKREIEGSIKEVEAILDQIKNRNPRRDIK